MSAPKTAEDRLLTWIEQTTGPLPESVQIGPGDDGAVIQTPSGDRLVLTIDTLVEGVDFETSSSSPQSVGQKSIAVSLSDLAAMGATPWVALASASFPSSTHENYAQKLVEGLRATASEYGVSIIGGDLSSTPGPISISTTLIGFLSTNRCLTRSGGHADDQLFVSGPLGGSILGRHLNVAPRIELGQKLVAIPATSAIDLSDGLLKDLSRLAQASGCGAEIQADKIPIHADAHRLSRSSEFSPLEHALFDGEDFELLFTLSPADYAMWERGEIRNDFSAIPIGQLTESTGLILIQADGNRETVSPKGFSHDWGVS